MKCHYIYDPVAGKVWIPECWGSVMSGPAGCYCRDKMPETFEAFERKEFRERLKGKQIEIRELEKENARLNRIIKKLLNHV